MGIELLLAATLNLFPGWYVEARCPRPGTDTYPETSFMYGPALNETLAWVVYTGLVTARCQDVKPPVYRELLQGDFTSPASVDVDPNSNW